jgi:hypothetical protein
MAHRNCHGNPKLVQSPSLPPVKPGGFSFYSHRYFKIGIQVLILIIDVGPVPGRFFNPTLPCEEGIYKMMAG